MKIGVVGTGNMGAVLGLVWAELGHEVFFGSRNLEKAQRIAALSNGGCQFGTNDEAAAFGELLFYNPRDVHPKDALGDVGLLDGKVVIEANNGPTPRPPHDFSFRQIDVSRAEELQQQVPNARIVAGFNTMAQETLDLCPDLIAEHDVSVFVAGDDDDARATVIALVREMGMAPFDCGALRNARTIENLADFIRYHIVSRGEPLTTLSVHTLPASTREPRLPARLPSRLP